MEAASTAEDRIETRKRVLILMAEYGMKHGVRKWFYDFACGCFEILKRVWAHYGMKVPGGKELRARPKDFKPFLSREQAEYFLKAYPMTEK